MSFDKVKAMRNAERFLAQGKIRAAINEYKRVVENEASDFSTLNMLGDLHAKTADKAEAVKCFTRVAEHYANQGFAQKSIAIYNKVLRLTPESLEISAKLAELYQMKGSVAEARSHYNILADQYSRTGRKAEALDVWKRIADLDPTNTDICLKIADACWQESQPDAAVSAYIQAGARLSAKKQFEPAITAFSKALEIKQDNLTALRGYVGAQFSLGYADEAAKALEEVLERQPYNREVIYLLVDSYLEMNDPVKAEKAVVNLVEQEPANYPKLLDVVQAYLRGGDLKAASRILMMTSEHLLVGGQAEELGGWVNQILAKNPEQVEALRLLVRYHGWQREEIALKEALERLAEAARTSEMVDDERYALSQLMVIAPQVAQFSDRWQELNALYGEADVYYETPLQKESGEIPTFENLAVVEGENEVAAAGEAVHNEYGAVSYTPDANGATEFAPAAEIAQPQIVENLEINGVAVQTPAPAAPDVPSLDELRMHDLRQELESVDFYILQGYNELAEKTLDDLTARFGVQPPIEEMRARLGSTSKAEDQLPAPPPTQAQSSAAPPVASLEAPAAAPPVTQSFAPPAEDVFVAGEFETAAVSADAKQFNPFDEFKDELEFDEEDEPVAEGDYETHYHLGIAYKEMGLMEDAIREFQEAVKFITANDGTRRYFLSCNMLGHCFMEKQMPTLALVWYQRALESNSLGEDELQGLRYEIANAYAMGGDREKALEYFEGIYAHNVDYRDVGMRLEDLRGV